MSIYILCCRVLEKIGPRALSKHLRTFGDYLVNEFVNPQSGNQYVQKCVDALNDLIWKCNIIPIDRLVLVLVSVTSSPLIA